MSRTGNYSTRGSRLQYHPLGNVQAPKHTVRASEEDLLQAAEGALSLLTSLKEDAFCNGITHGGRDEGDHWAGVIIDRLRSAIDKYKTDRQEALEKPIMARIQEWLR